MLIYNLETKIQESREIIMRLEYDAQQATKTLQEIERKIEDAQVEHRSFEEVLRLVRREERKSASVKAHTTLLRPGTKVSKVRDAIREAGGPLHIKEIMERIGEPADLKTRTSLVGSLSKYVKTGKIFTRTGTSTFGLKPTEGWAETM